jgi:hypothetical protein
MAASMRPCARSRPASATGAPSSTTSASRPAWTTPTSTRTTSSPPAGLAPGARELTALTEVYLQPWIAGGHPRAAVDRALPPALRIAPFARVLTWGRIFPCYLAQPDPGRSAARALAAALEASALG